MSLFFNIILAGIWVGAMIYVITNIFDLLVESKKNGKSRKR
jgi:hypothetical protein